MLPIKMGLVVAWFARPRMVDFTAYALWGVLVLTFCGYVAIIIHEKSKKN
ncbi:hypothetical protein [Lactiplantibacillus garii]|nr:hypothetical protein [Lactiplantibacillus garii]